MSTGIKTFVFGEIGKALGRFKVTLLLMLKIGFISLVNVVFWLLPLMFMGYVLGRPVINGMKRSAPVYSPASFPSDQLRHTEDRHLEGEPALDIRGMLSQAASFVREIRFLKRP